MEHFMLLGLCAGLCTVLGAGLLMLKKKWSPRNLALFLGLAAGVMTAVVLLDMLPAALSISGFRPTVLGSAAGILVMYLQLKRGRSSVAAGSSMRRLGYLIMLGIAWHDLPEGAAIALAGNYQEQAGWIIAFGLGVHNAPEGMAIAAPLIIAGVSKAKILAQITLLSLITPLGTFIGQQAIAYLPNLIAPLMGFASGIMMYIVVGQLVPQSFSQDKKHAIYGVILGWLVIVLASNMV
ncbi:MAG: ZIP family metal transporter [Syntrophomonadaceae bacterium]|nr:ZIP family metal transporter [Syntrophomonadaceae bacterium]